MGFRYTDAAFKTTAVRAMEKYVLLLICERTNNETGVCWPSLRTIAADGGIALSTVQDKVEALESRGILTVAHNGETRASNRYKVNLDAITVPNSGTEGENAVPTGGIVAVPTGGIVVPTTDTDCTDQRYGTRQEPITEPVSPNPSLERMKEGRKEGTASVASLPTPSEAPAPTLENFLKHELVADEQTETWRIGTMNDIIRVSLLWLELTLIYANSDSIAQDVVNLTWSHGYNTLVDNMPLILRDCPKTAAVAWKDFHYFAENFDRSLRNARAWKRKLQAQLHAKGFGEAARP